MKMMIMIEHSPRLHLPTPVHVAAQERRRKKRKRK
jgi:hypothetical protein